MQKIVYLCVLAPMEEPGPDKALKLNIIFY